MNYIGSKKRLLPFILSAIKEEAPNLETLTVCDLFAGTGIVGQTLKPLVKHVISNDLEYYSYVMNQHYVQNNISMNMTARLKELNTLPGKKGFIYTHYCLESGSERQYFSNENGQKIDAIRQKIETWQKKNQISIAEYYYLLTCLLESADKVANTASVYGAFLKKLKKSAQQPLLLTPLANITTPHSHQVYQEDANTLLPKLKGDILYLDPPYNNRQYGNYYHMLNTIADYKEFTPKGKTGMRPFNRSAYCIRKQAHKALENLIQNAQFSIILLSYNNEGIIPQETIKSIFKQNGTYSLKKRSYFRYKADSNRSQKSTKTEEYLHILKKNIE